MTASEFIKKVFFIEIMKGLALTVKHFLSPSITRQYPVEKREPVPGARGLHALVRDAETGNERCVGCGLCAAMCPSQCIHIYTSEGEEHQKIVDRYEVEVLRCVYCALCVEACPYAALVLTEHFEYSGYTREEFYYTKEMLLENWDKYMSGTKGMNYIKNFWSPRSGDFARKVESQPAEKVEK